MLFLRGAGFQYARSYYGRFQVKAECSLLLKIFKQETPPGSRLDRTYLIKDLDGTCVMAHQREASTDITELLTRLT